jgi:hypothetical protein
VCHIVTNIICRYLIVRGEDGKLRAFHNVSC